MQRTLSLSVVLLGGCYVSHTTSSVEGGVCSSAVADEVLSIECPPSVAPGESASVVVVHRGPFCCAASEPRVALDRHDRGIDVSAQWNECACCDAGGECPCTRRIEWRTVLDTGPIAAGPFVVRAGGMECRIEVESGACEPARVTEVIAPRVVRLDDPVPVLLRGESNGCGCVPRARALERPFVELELCDCSNEDPCVDPGYQATTQLLLPEGEHTVLSSEGGPGAPVTVSARCSGPAAARITEVEALAPDPSLIRGEVDATWLRVRGIELRCCLEPLVATAFARPAPGQRRHDVPLFDCAPEPCDCDEPIPMPFELDVFLGPLEPGPHTVHVAGSELELVVP